MQLKKNRLAFIINFKKDYSKELLFAKNNLQQTLLFAVLQGRRLETLYYLLTHGTRNNRKELCIDYKKNSNGSGILHFLVERNDPDVFFEIFLLALTLV